MAWAKKQSFVRPYFWGIDFALTERQNFLAMQTKCNSGNIYAYFAHGLYAAVVAVVALLPARAEAEVNFKNTHSAMQQGVSAYRTGNFKIAIPALEYAAKHNIFPARYYLARIYGTHSITLTDHAKAFYLLHEFIQVYANTDPADYRKAPTVARAMTRLARYIRDGLPEIGVRADAKRAAEYFHHSATFFDDADAQFELAKLQLTGDGVRRSERFALHWLSVLSRKGHPGAQAFLADLNWRGKYTERNPIRSLILIELAIENASQEDRVWVEDIYQNIFCGVSDDTKIKVSGMLSRWRSQFGRPAQEKRSDVLHSLNVGPQRSCADGQIVSRLTPREFKPEKDQDKFMSVARTHESSQNNSSDLQFKQIDAGSYHNASDNRKAKAD